jgi:hypothetical protein
MNIEEAMSELKDLLSKSYCILGREDSANKQEALEELDDFLKKAMPYLRKLNDIAHEKHEEAPIEA